MVQKREPAGAANQLAARDIRRIREKIGLTQVEAGELLGGGPRAFTKYESGKVKPAASITNLLKLLDANPSAIATLSGGKVTPISQDNGRANEVTGKHVAALTDRKLAMLTRRLLDAEALSGQLPMDGIHVAANITATDGGEDARIEWQGGPDRTPYLPHRLTQFQLKAGKISPAEAGDDVLTTRGEIKQMVRDALERGGTYVMVCGHSYDRQRATARGDRIHESLSQAGLVIDRQRIQFRDADQLASWINTHPGVAAWLLEQTQPGLVGPFKDWAHWSGRYDHSPWISDERLNGVRDGLRNVVMRPQGVARVLGVSGVGKSRLVHEALGPTEKEEVNSPRLCDLVLYAVETEAGSIAVKNAVQSLSDTGFRAIVVVDRCPAATHQDLAAMVKRGTSNVSLITIDHEAVPIGRNDKTVLYIEQASTSVIEGMVGQILPNLPSEDHRRLVRFAQGFPQIAILVGQAWSRDASIASATDDELFDRIILGRKPSDAPLLTEAGMLLGVFRLLGTKNELKDLKSIAHLSRGRRSKDLSAAFDELQQRGVVQRHGRLISLQPKPLALCLAERQWRQWDEAVWDDVLGGSLPERLRVQAAKQLAMLNDRDIASDVVKYVTRPAGPFSSLEGMSRKGNAKIVSALSEIDSDLALTLFERVLSPLSYNELLEVNGELRRNLVHALEKIAFIESSFERAALLMLNLAVAENETWGNNATGQFKALFPVFLANTAATGDTRLRLLDELIRQNRDERMPHVVEALLAATNLRSSSRLVGSETHGSRPALEPWRPEYWKDVWTYVFACMDRLCSVALRSDTIGSVARKGMVHNFRKLAVAGHLDRVEEWVNKVHAAHSYWPEAMEALGDVLQYDRDKLKQGEECRIRAMLNQLNPNDLIGKAKLIVTEMPWDYPIDEKLTFKEREARQVEAVEGLARDLLKVPSKLNALISQISVGNQRMSSQFGRALAMYAEAPLELEHSIKSAYLSAPEDTRNYGLLAGYYAALQDTNPEVVETFKSNAANSPELGTVLPFLCLQTNITANDVALVCKGLKSGNVPINSVIHWSVGSKFAELCPDDAKPLLDTLLEMDGEAYSICLEIMGMYVHRDIDRLNELKAQLRRAVECLSKRPKRRGSQMDLHEFQDMVLWLLNKGYDDKDARETALELAIYLATNAEDAYYFANSLLPVLLSQYAPVVWPQFAKVVCGDTLGTWHVEHLLGESVSFDGKETPAILSLPDDIMFTWAHSNPQYGPAFLAKTLPILTSSTEGDNTSFHPLALRLIDEFGEREDVRSALVANMHTFGWSGSVSTYYALYVQPLKSLLQHPIGEVRRWASTSLTDMENEIATAKEEDEEQDASWNA